MSPYPLTAALDLPPPLDDTDAAIARWVLAHGGSRLLALLAAWLRHVEGDGDSCLALGDGQRRGAPQLDAAAIEALRNEALVGDGTTRCAFVLDRFDRLYFWRNWRHEARIAETLLARRGQRDAKDSAGIVHAVFADSDPAHDGQQRAAVRRALDSDLLILTGGPGTGKTRTALRLLLARQLAQSAPLKLVLAAPTGKAAQRLNESLQAGLAALAAQATPALQAAMRQLPPASAQTVHRALAWSPQRHAFLRDANNRLDADIVLVDEVSMLDLATLRALCDAVPAGALLVLMGDAEQLVSVSAGSVLDDIVRTLEPHLPSPVVRLSHGFRSDAALGPAIGAARDGDIDALRDALRSHPGRLAWQPQVDGAALERLVQDWADELRDALGDLPRHRGAEAATALLQAWQGQQLLCARRDGRWGASTLAAQIDARLRAAWGAGHTPLVAGSSLLVTHNDYFRQLFNGDVGVLLADDSGRLRAWFAPLQPGDPPRDFAPGDLPAHTSAAAITVHKSQGSEYDHIALLLPPQPELPLLNRQLVYTALSRARQRIDVWSSEASLAAALARRSERLGGLRERLGKAP